MDQQGEKRISYGKRIKYLGKLIGCLADANLEHCGVTGAQCRLLIYLYVSSENGSTVYQRDVESEFGIKRSSVTSILGNIEKNGYIIRTGDKSDARLKRIEITESGRKLAEHLTGYIDRLENEIVRDMDDNERNLFISLLQRAIVNIQTSQLADETDIILPQKE